MDAHHYWKGEGKVAHRPRCDGVFTARPAIGTRRSSISAKDWRAQIRSAG